MKKYELIFILKAELPESEMEARVARVGEILGAYEIEYESRGNYMFLKFKSEGTAVADLDKFLRLDDQVLRHLIVVDEEWDERNRAAIAKRRQNQPAENTAPVE